MVNREVVPGQTKFPKEPIWSACIRDSVDSGKPEGEPVLYEMNRDYGLFKTITEILGTEVLGRPFFLGKYKRRGRHNVISPMVNIEDGDADVANLVSLLVFANSSYMQNFQKAGLELYESEKTGLYKLCLTNGGKAVASFEFKPVREIPIAGMLEYGVIPDNIKIKPKNELGLGYFNPVTIPAGISGK
ncbi:hypothetical protein ACFL1B_03335 [Nanoarchaeota archaeon]